MGKNGKGYERDKSVNKPKSLNLTKLSKKKRVVPLSRPPKNDTYGSNYEDVSQGGLDNETLNEEDEDMLQDQEVNSYMSD
jgi:hypothetical protein